MAGQERLWAPLANWDGSSELPPDLVWWVRLDGRWQVEVQHLDRYNGMLCIFDHDNQDACVHREEVPLSYGAIWGPDNDDVRYWQELALNFVDHQTD